MKKVFIFAYSVRVLQPDLKFKTVKETDDEAIAVAELKANIKKGYVAYMDCYLIDVDLDYAKEILSDTKV